MTENLLKVTRTLVGIGCALIAAEGVAIATNAAIDDVGYWKGCIADRLSPKPEPVKRGLFGRKKGVK